MFKQCYYFLLVIMISFNKIKSFCLSTLVASAAIGVIYTFAKNKKKEPDNQPVEVAVRAPSSEIFLSSNSIQEQQKQRYSEPVKDPYQYHILQKTENNYHVTNIKYEIILNLKKGLAYQGSVKLSFSGNVGIRDLEIDFNGQQINFLEVNGIKLKPMEVTYVKQKIYIPNQYLQQQNTIELIFTNKYSFFDDGMSTYFKIDENNKYSLKEQCIYTKNGLLNISKIIPNLNTIQQCIVNLKVIHPENLNVISNTQKQIIKLCKLTDFPEYRFFVDENKLQQSIVFNHNNLMSSKVSSKSVKSWVKSYTKFKEIKLESIHEFFVACLPTTQIKYHHIEKLKLNLRFYGLNQTIIEQALQFIYEILSQLQKYQMKLSQSETYQNKIDIIFLKSDKIDGYFTKGVILLKDSYIKKGLKMKTIYLIIRALLGMMKFRWKLNDIINLNEKTVKLIPQFKKILCLKQILYDSIKSLNRKNQIYESYMLQVFDKQIKYLCNVNNLEIDKQTLIWYNKLKDYSQKSHNQYLQFLIDNIELLDSAFKNLIIKITLKKFNYSCQNSHLIENLKHHLQNNKYFIYFLSDSQVEKYFSLLLTTSQKYLEFRLPSLHLLEINPTLIKTNSTINRYFYLKTNIDQINQLYQKFYNFDENSNFHHVSIVEKEIRRISSFMRSKLNKSQEIHQQWTINVCKTMRLLGLKSKVKVEIDQMIKVYTQINKFY